METLVKKVVYHPISIDFLLGREHDEKIVENYKTIIIEEIKGFEIAVKNIDKFIKLVKRSKSKDEANELIVKAFGLTQHQSEMILLTKVSDIAKLNLQVIQKKLKEITI